MSEQITQADIFSAFGITPPGAGTPPPEGTPPATPPATDPTPPDPATPPATPPDPAANAGDPKPAEPPEPPKPAEDKSGQRFAEMRVQIKTLETTLTDVAEILGIPKGTPQNELINQIKDAVLAAQSKKQGIPEEILRQNRETTERLAALENERMQTQAYQQFQKVQDKYKLTPAQVSQFADQLLAEGKNPFATPMDLIREYRLMNYDTILENERKAAIKEEQERAAKAASHASAPNQSQGTGSGDPAKVNSVKDLEQLSIFK